MEFRELKIAGAYEITPKQFGDPRGLFYEAYKAPMFGEKVGHEFDLKQVNGSVSAAGAVRGIHFADVPPGQAKYIQCFKGAVLDVLVDIRVGSPTFGVWDTIVLDDETRRSVYVPEGIGHGFMSLEDDSMVVYLCSAIFTPEREHGVHPLDPDLGIEWPTEDRYGNPITPQLSAKDEAAPSLKDALATDLLPKFDEVTAFIDSLNK